MRKWRLGLLLLISVSAWGEYTQSKPGLARPLPGGIVYPSLFSSVEVNPAALLHDPKTVVGLEVQTPWRGATTSNVIEGFASGGKYFGMGVLIGASTTSTANNVSVNRATVGMAAGLTGSAIGVNVSYDMATGTGVDVDLGLAVENVSGFQLSILLTSVQAFRSTGAFNVGFGFSRPQSVQIEASWSYALFAVSQQHVLSLNSIFYFGILGLGANFAYTTSATGSSSVFGPALSLAFSPRVVLSARGYYDTALGTRAIFCGNLAF